MSAFDHCSKLAARSLQSLGPLLLETQGRYVLTDKGRHSKFFQETFGDLLFNDLKGRMYVVELKAEETWTGNLFLETWSNFTFNNKESHFRYGPNPGWLLKLNADLLFYHFLNEDRVVIMSMPELQRWAFMAESKNMSEPDARGERRPLIGRVWDFRQRAQRKHEQGNLTIGALVPVSVLEKEMRLPPRIRSVRQMTFDFLNALAPPEESS